MKPSDITERRRSVGQTQLHSESLLNVPLIKQVFSDLSYQFTPRGIDPNWWYERQLPITLTGFNPFESSFYYSKGSRFEAWLTDPFGSAREFNESDLLLRELLFMVHDYLHTWAYLTIDRLQPSLQILNGPITSETYEDYVFCHLLTEAVATVGLDYWFLCQNNINDYCPIGSNMGPLTVSYREVDLPEYRRFFPQLDIQTPDFLRTLAVFYCSGAFLGFDANDLRHSPKLLTWLRHELTYGVTQRSLAREWLAYLATEPIELAGPDSKSAPVSVDTELRRYLIDELGPLLWAKIENKDITSETSVLKQPDFPPSRHAPLTKALDFRFVNLSRLAEEEWKNIELVSAENFKFFLYQFIGQIKRSPESERKLRHLSLLLQQRDISLVLDLMGDLPRCEYVAGEPRDLMIAN